MERWAQEKYAKLRKGGWSMTQWIRWVEFMQPWEAVQFCKAIVSSHEELDLVAWIREERQGRLIYRADICGHTPFIAAILSAPIGLSICFPCAQIRPSDAQICC